MSAEATESARAHLEVVMDHRKILAAEHPEWLQEFEDIDPFVADRGSVEDLVVRAPNDFAAGMLCGILMFRQQLSAMTGREF